MRMDIVLNTNEKECAECKASMSHTSGTKCDRCNGTLCYSCCKQKILLEDYTDS
jgi:hypothetical protein